MALHLHLRPCLLLAAALLLAGSAAADLEYYPDDYGGELQRYIEVLANRKSEIPYSFPMKRVEDILPKQRIPDYIYEDSQTDFSYYPDPPKANTSGKKPFAVSPLQPEYFIKPRSRFIDEPDLTEKEDLKKIDDSHYSGMVFEEPRKQRQNPNLAANKMNKIATNLESVPLGALINRKFTSERDIPTSLVPTSSRHQHVIQQALNNTSQEYKDIHIYIQAAMLGTGAAAIIIVLSLGLYTLFLLRRHSKDAADAEYPAYGVTGPNTDVTPSGDRRLAHSAQMYHYQHQKQQIIAMENSRTGAAERNGSVSDAESEDENEEGDYTVYECPGFATTGEMEVKNPLFSDEPTPQQQASAK